MAGTELKLRYLIVENGRAIRCLTCNMTSWSTGDVEHRFCAKCGVFHEDEGLHEFFLRQAAKIDLEKHLNDLFTGRDPGV